MGLANIETFTARFAKMAGGAAKAVKSGNFDQVASNVRHLGEQAGLSADEIADLTKTLSEAESGGTYYDAGPAIKRFTLLASRALVEQEKAQLKVTQAVAGTRKEAERLYVQQQKNIAQSKAVLKWVDRLIESSETERKSRGRSAAAAAKAVKAETAGLVIANRLQEMEQAGATKMEIASRKLEDAYAETDKMSTKRDFQRANKAEKVRKAEMDYLKEFATAQDAAAKAKEDAGKKAAEAGQREIDRLTEIGDNFDRLALDAEADRVDRLSMSMLGFGQHVEGAAMSVSSSAPAIAASFGSIGAVVGIMGDNVGDFAAAAPKSLSAIGAITAGAVSSVKAQATIQSLFEFAAGIASAARLDFWGASQHALAGSMFAAVAGTAGGGKKSAGTSAGGGVGAGGLASGGAGSALSTSMASSVTVNVQGLMSGTSADLGVALGESLSDVKTTGLGSRSV